MNYIILQNELILEFRNRTLNYKIIFFKKISKCNTGLNNQTLSILENGILIKIGITFRMLCLKKIKKEVKILK